MEANQDSVDAARELRRVQHHIAGAEVLAQSSRVQHGRVATLNRHLLLDELRRYRALGRFPKNRDFPGRAVPYFVDSDGTHCAVGHLMAISGHGDLVEHIRRTNNFGKVRELSRLAEVRAWVHAAGLTLGEAARIQPSYCYYSQAEACFCNQGSATTAALVTVIESDGAMATVRVDRVAGAPGALRVGDELSLAESGQVGEQWLIGNEGDAGPYYRKGQSYLSIEDDQVLSGAV